MKGNILRVGMIVLFIIQLYFLERTVRVQQVDNKGNSNCDDVVSKNTVNNAKINMDPTLPEETIADEKELNRSSFNSMRRYHGRNHQWTLVIAIPTVAEKSEARTRIRSTYLTFYEHASCLYKNNCNDTEVIVLFFVGKMSNERLKAQMYSEQQMFHDIIELDIEENMNKGKTYHVFEWIYRNLDTKYAMKADDDTFILIPNLLNKLKYFETFVIQPGKIYYGFECDLRTSRPPSSQFMCGMGYVVGRDLLKWIATDKYPRDTKSHNSEDITAGSWVQTYGSAVVIGNRLQFHEPPTHSPSRVAFEYNCEDIVVHPLKTLALWSQASQYYFNCCDKSNNNAVTSPFCQQNGFSETKCSKGSGVVCYPETIEVLGVYPDSANYFDDGRHAKETVYVKYFQSNTTGAER